MKRLIDNYLLKWKNDPERKPLLVYGARQVGKTYSIYEFGLANYDNVIYLNFEGNAGLKAIFDPDLVPNRIIDEIESVTNQKVLKDKTLIVFDEIQECEKALTSLKYFCEERRDVHIIAAGSLLGLAVNRGHYSFPVGKVNMVTMYPLNFEEFLMALDQYELIDKIKEAYRSSSALPSVVHNTILEYYHKYLIVGGMPSAVQSFVNNKDYGYVKIIQDEILSSYRGDMTKYVDLKESDRIIAAYNSIPSQLAKENKKFLYSLIGSGARARTYEDAIEWLKTAGVVYKCNKVTEGTLPLKIHEDFLSFKMYMNDVGLLTDSLNISAKNILTNNLSSDAKGTLAENYIMQQLVSIGIYPYYWESRNSAEVDFVIQLDDEVVPIECKYADNVKAKSLTVFANKYSPKYSIRVSSKNFGFENNIKSVPLYAVFCLKEKI